MEHTDFREKYDAIREMEREELVNALKRLGGHYSFVDESENEVVCECCTPCVVQLEDYGPQDLMVSDIELKENGALEILAVESESPYNYMDVHPEYLIYGSYSNILDCLPDIKD